MPFQWEPPDQPDRLRRLGPDRGDLRLLPRQARRRPRPHRGPAARIEQCGPRAQVAARR
ncbi:MAG: hypothetical protein WDN45_05570 [Caulobacteraceae bacterium]